MKTKTHEQPHKTEVENSQDPTWEAIKDYVDSITEEPDFVEYTTQLGISSVESVEYAEALSEFSEKAIEHQVDLISDKVAAQIRLVANIPYLVHSSQTIQHYRDSLARNKGRLPRDEWNDYNLLKKRTIWYNQMLSSYMYDYADSERFSDISQTITDQALDHTPYDVKATADITKSTLDGARTEAAARHLLESIGVPFRTATPAEDMRGADIIIETQKGDIDVDIKKSLDQLAGNENGYDALEAGRMYSIQTYKGRKKLLLFPGFTNADLGDGLKLSEATTEERKYLIGAQLMRALGELQQ